jgi:copper(I)-binding protein
MRIRAPEPDIFRSASRLLAAAALAIALDAGAQTAVVDFNSTWMRPALAGQARARAYVDIKSDTALTLTGAETPVARAIEFVTVSGTNGAEETVVPTVPVAPGTPTRLAFRGNHLRLLEINRDLLNGEQFPVTLRFTDAQGGVVNATATVVVRGFTVPPEESAPRRP